LTSSIRERVTSFEALSLSFFLLRRRAVSVEAMRPT